jgi:hypothetical protein
MLTLSCPSSCVLQWRERLEAPCSAASEAAARHAARVIMARGSQGDINTNGKREYCSAYLEPRTRRRLKPAAANAPPAT